MKNILISPIKNPPNNTGLVALDEAREHAEAGYDLDFGGVVVLVLFFGENFDFIF